MELGQLKYFVTIAEAMSFTGAAERLHVSQPALSYQMRHLESDLGTSLFDRRGRRITLTAEGELFLPLAQAVLLGADEAVRVVREHLGVDVGEVHMGCNPTVATTLVPGILVSFRESYPQVRVDVVEGDDPHLQRLIHQGLLDFAVVTAPGSPQTLKVIPLGGEDIVLVVGLQHRLAGCESIALSALADEDFVVPIHAYNIKVHLFDACRAAGFEPKITYRTSSIEAVKNLARQGLGIAAMPSISIMGKAGEDLAIIAVEGGLTRELNLVLGKGRSISRMARALMEIVRSSVSASMKHPAASELPPQETPTVAGPGLTPSED